MQIEFNYPEKKEEIIDNINKKNLVQISKKRFGKIAKSK